MIDDDLGMVAANAAEEQFPAISALGAAAAAGPAPYAARLAASRAAQEQVAFPALGGGPADTHATQPNAGRG